MSVIETTIDGVIYTSVFNPEDGRKNWQDMVTAFCYAFKEEPDTTLVLKFVSNKTQEAEQLLLNLLHKSSPFKCRVVASSSFLGQEDFENLIRHSAFYVNTSHGEGQCLPLMEFLSCGIPAIAPRVSAMADYIDSDIAFLINASEEITHWQHDERRRFRTLQSRIDWSSLVAAYRESLRVFKTDKTQYDKMSIAAVEHMQHHCSQDKTKLELKSLLDKVLSVETDCHG